MVTVFRLRMWERSEPRTRCYHDARCGACGIAVAKRRAMVEDWRGGAGSTVPGDDPTAGPEASPPNVPQVPAPSQPNYAPQPADRPGPWFGQSGYPQPGYPPSPSYPPCYSPQPGFQPWFGPGSYAPPGPGPGVVWGGIGLRFGALALAAVMLVGASFA